MEADGLHEGLATCRAMYASPAVALPCTPPPLTEAHGDLLAVHVQVRVGQRLAQVDV